jgi:hypothetical protein
MDIVEQKKIGLIFIFVNLHWELSPELLNKLRSKAYLVFWLFDEENQMLPYTIYLSQTADAVISTDYYGCSLYEQLDIPAIPYPSFYQEEEYAVIDVPKKYDVSFVGMYNKSSRRELVDYLTDNGINVVVFGAGAPGGYVSREEMINIFRQSKINLNFSEMGQLSHHLKMFPWHKRIRQRKGRPIEIAMTGNFCLSQYSPDAKEIFKPETELIEFYDKEDLLKKVKYYLDNDKEREKIAEQAHKRAIEEYESTRNFPKLFDRLMQILSKRDSKRQPKVELIYSSFYYTQLAYFYILYALIMLKHGKIKNSFELCFKLLSLSPFTVFRGIAMFLMPKKKYING